MSRSRTHIAARGAVAVLLSLPLLGEAGQDARRASSTPPHALELSRPVRPWEFLSAVGPRAGLFGIETGRFEAWVYPLKILRDFHLKFHVSGRTLPAESLARTVTVRPEAASIDYAGDSFRVRQTLFVPVREPGAVVLIETQSSEPIEVEAGFQRDFQLMWPASLGGTYMDWSEDLRAFTLGEERKKFFAIVGSPSAVEHRQEYFSNYASATESSFKLERLGPGSKLQVIVIAASFESQGEAEKIYRRLSEDFRQLLEAAANHYEQYLGQTISVRLPDPQLQLAYDWSRVSVLQGMVSNPFLGTGLIAGYRTSGDTARPGFAWFFGRDALWTTLALVAAGDFENARTALEFLARQQREDGKIPHEISQSASFVPWFKDYPYGYASADATPLFLIAMNEYAVRSGNVAFVQAEWTQVRKAHEFLRSTWDAQGFAQNHQVGHGWVEGGPLLPVRTEFYQSGLGIAALGALANLARLTGRGDAARELDREFARQQPSLNQAFWIPEKNIFAFGFDLENKTVQETSVLATVPMWLGLVDANKANAMINQLADFDHATDWGMRIISSKSPKFGPAGYHFGSVWPLFTGWAAVGEYRYHRAIPAFANLRANALLALDGSPGHVTEVLSGSFYEPLSTSSPHQIWSAAMVISPLLRGLLGLETNAMEGRVVFSPHAPAHWDALRVHNLAVGGTQLDFAYRRSADTITLELQRAGAGKCVLEFSPAVSLRAEVLGVEINERPAAFQVASNSADQHVVVRFPVYGGRTALRIRLRNDFALDVPANLPPLGAPSRNLRLVSESWNATRDQLQLDFSAPPGSEWRLPLIGAEQIANVGGAELEKDGAEPRLFVRFPMASTEGFICRKVTIQFFKTPAPPAKSGSTAGRATNESAARDLAPAGIDLAPGAQQNLCCSASHRGDVYVGRGILK